MDRRTFVQMSTKDYSEIAKSVVDGIHPPWFFNSGAIDLAESEDKYTSIYKHLIEHYSIPTNNKTLIELGCGFGKGCYFLKKKYNLAEVVGCDINADVIDVARRLYTKTRFFIEDIVDLHKLDQQFDIALTIETADYWINHPSINASLSSVVKRGGCLLIATDYRKHLNIEKQLKDFRLMGERDITHNVLLSLNETVAFQSSYRRRIRRLNSTHKYVSQFYIKREQ